MKVRPLIVGAFAFLVAGPAIIMHGEWLMKLETRLALQAQVRVGLVAVLLAEVLVLLGELASRIMSIDVPASAIAMFGVCTVVLATGWVRSDARHAFEDAVRAGYVELDDRGAVVLYIAPWCPRRWFVILHIRLHPALIGCEVAPHR
jgi:hypothetical protein